MRQKNNKTTADLHNTKKKKTWSTNLYPLGKVSKKKKRKLKQVKLG